MVFLLLLIYLLHAAVSFAGEILIIRVAGFTFGNTLYASSVVFAVVFAGIAAGALFWGKRVDKSQKPLRMFAKLELLRALCLVITLLVLRSSGLFKLIIPDSFAYTPNLLLFSQSGILLAVLFPWAFFWGGQFPAISRYVGANTRKPQALIALCYGMDGLGAFGGIILLSFGLLPLAGITSSAVVLTVISVLIASLIWFRYSSRVLESIEEIPKGHAAASNQLRDRGIAFISGFGVLGVELLVSRAFSLVTHNSIYSDAVSLATFMISLSLGAIIVATAGALKKDVPLILTLFVASGLLFLIPYAFVGVTQGVLPIFTDQTMYAYLAQIGMKSAMVFLLPIASAGMVFPVLLTDIVKRTGVSGLSFGKLLFAGSLGAVCAILFFGFSVIESSLWENVWLIAALYMLTCLYLVLSEVKRNRKLAIRHTVILATIALAGPFLFAQGLPDVLDENVRGRGMRVREITEKGGNIAAVVQAGNRRHLLVNNQYSVGSNGLVQRKRNQTLIPMAMHPAPKKICFVGMGTGITAGAALADSVVETVVVCEILPGVVELAEKYFAEYTHGLFTDKRSTVLGCDGRTFLTFTEDRFDLIISELFIPWQSGTANLYTRDFYMQAQKRLEEDGMFVQWLPLFQITYSEFAVIAKTYSQVFPHATIWRIHFDTKQPVVALIGRKNGAPIDANVIMAKLRKRGSPYARIKDTRYMAPLRQDFGESFFTLYMGDCTVAAKKLWNEYPINTDNRQAIEFSASKSVQNVYANETTWLISDDYSRLCRRLYDTVSPKNEAIISIQDECFMNMVKAGYETVAGQSLSNGYEPCNR
ncbi:MAG: fused MFS/spermidine synthase [Fibrobacterota bacterium]